MGLKPRQHTLRDESTNPTYGLNSFADYLH
jgi:hypothetical protein